MCGLGQLVSRSRFDSEALSDRCMEAHGTGARILVVTVPMVPRFEAQRRQEPPLPLVFPLLSRGEGDFDLSVFVSLIIISSAFSPLSAPTATWLTGRVVIQSAVRTAPVR